MTSYQTNHEGMVSDMQSRVRPSLLKQPRILVAVAFVLGWFFDWAFYGKPLGVNLFIYTALLAVGLLGLSLIEQIDMSKSARWLLPPMLFFAAMGFIRANVFVTSLNVLAVMLLLMYYAWHFASQSEEDSFTQQTIGHYIGRPLAVMLYTTFSPFVAVREALHAPIGREDAQSNLLPILRGLLIALPIVIVFAGLLASADLIFAQRLDMLFNFPAIDELIGRSILITFIAWLATGALYFGLTHHQLRLSKLQAAKVGETPAEQPRLAFLRIGFIESTIVLNAINLLFITFVILQFGYLFGGVRHIEIEGYSYAEYARRGFFELVVVAMLTLGLLLLINALTRRESARQTRIFNISNMVLIFCVTIMLVSAFQRLRLYELTWGFTELRLYSHTFIVWLGVVFLWFAITLWWRPNLFLFGLFICMLGFVATLNVMNPDQLIVQHNWTRYKLTNQLEESTNISQTRQNQQDRFDSYYITTLSNDAIPALLGILDDSSIETPQTLRSELILELRKRHKSLADRAESVSWQSWHFSHARGKLAIERGIFLSVD